jgi:hypothetical protein
MLGMMSLPLRMGWQLNRWTAKGGRQRVKDHLLVKRHPAARSELPSIPGSRTGLFLC